MTFRASVLILLRRSNLAILAAYNSFMRILAACGASSPRTSESNDLQCLNYLWHSHGESQRLGPGKCFLIRCRARHNSCDGRLLRNVGQTSEISMNVRSNNSNTKQHKKNPNKKQHKTKTPPEKRSRSTAVKR